MEALPFCYRFVGVQEGYEGVQAAGGCQAMPS